MGAILLSDKPWCDFNITGESCPVCGGKMGRCPVAVEVTTPGLKMSFLHPRCAYIWALHLIKDAGQCDRIALERGLVPHPFFPPYPAYSDDHT